MTPSYGELHKSESFFEVIRLIKFQTKIYTTTLGKLIWIFCFELYYNIIIILLYIISAATKIQNISSNASPMPRWMKSSPAQKGNIKSIMDETKIFRWWLSNTGARLAKKNWTSYFQASHSTSSPKPEANFAIWRPRSYIFWEVASSMPLSSMRWFLHRTNCSTRINAP